MVGNKTRRWAARLSVACCVPRQPRWSLFPRCSLSCMGLARARRARPRSARNSSTRNEGRTTMNVTDTKQSTEPAGEHAAPPVVLDRSRKLGWGPLLALIVLGFALALAILVGIHSR